MRPAAWFRPAALLLLAPPLAAVACAAAQPGRSSTGRVETREVSRTVRVGETVELAAGEAVTLAGAARTLSFARVVEDSRCPREVTCVWAGRAVVELAVGGPGSGPKPVRLEVGDAPEEAGAGILLAAVALEPWPRAQAATRPEDYRLLLKIAAAGAPPTGER